MKSPKVTYLSPVVGLKENAHSERILFKKMEITMKKLFVLFGLLVIASLALAACGTAKVQTNGDPALTGPQAEPMPTEPPATATATANAPTPRPCAPVLNLLPGKGTGGDYWFVLVATLPQNENNIQGGKKIATLMEAPINFFVQIQADVTACDTREQALEVLLKAIYDGAETTALQNLITLGYVEVIE